MKKLNKYGFSLLELTIVIFIMATLSALIIANFRKGETQKRVAFAADTVTSALNSTQGAALSSKKIQGCNSSDYFTVFKPNSTTISLACGVITFDTSKLPSQTQLQAGGIKVDGAVVPGLIVYFTSPFAKIRVCTNPIGLVCAVPITSFGQATIPVQSSTDPAVIRIITIDGVSGRIQ